MAFFLGGLRYDAGHGAVGGSAPPIVAIEPDRGGRPGIWTVTNAGTGVVEVLAVRVTGFPQAGVRWTGAVFELLRTPISIERGGRGSFESSFRGDDVLVAVRLGDGDRGSVCWTRFLRVDRRGDYEKREEGPLLYG